MIKRQITNCVMAFFVNFFAIFAIICTVNCDKVRNVHVRTQTDLTMQLVHTKTVIEFENLGHQPLTQYSYILAEEGAHFISFFTATGNRLNYLKIEKNSTIYQVNLGQKIETNEKFLMVAQIVFGGKVQPLQKVRKIEDDQLVKFRSNFGFFSLYPTIICRNEFVLNHDALVEISPSPDELSRDKIVYFSHNIKPLDHLEAEIIFVNNDALLTVKNLKRTIEINHFGKIFIRDSIVLENIGSKLVGPFVHRFINFERKGESGWLFTHLPASAQNIKFFDDIGNSSDSQIFHFLDHLSLKFKPRYHLLGSWKTSYNLQYDVPIYEYLDSTAEDVYILKIRAFDHVLNDKIVETAEVEIILPEGAQFIRIVTPPGLTFKGIKGNFGNLGIFAMVTIVLNGQNLFENHISDVYIEYSYCHLYLIKASIVVASYLQVVFLIFIVYRKYFM